MRRNRQNLNSIYLHNLSALEIVNIMNSEDAKIAEIVKHSLPEIAKAVELIKKRLKKPTALF
jgi:N-acetylmuramic acid 6-phosphate etherase